MFSRSFKLTAAILALLATRTAVGYEFPSARHFANSEADLPQPIFPPVPQNEEKSTPTYAPPALSTYEESSPQVLFNWHSGEDNRPAFDPDAPITTDRPDFTEASITVGRGVTQLETGYTYFYNGDDGGSVRTQSFGEPLLRHGIIANWLELRVAVFPLEKRTRDSTTSNSTAGVGDMLVGLKFGLTAQEGVLPEMAIVPQMLVPVGSNAFTDNHVLPGVNWLYGWDLSDDLSTGGSTQFIRAVDGETDDDFTLWAQSWTVGMSVTEKLGSYVEWFGLFPAAAETEKTQLYLNGGLTYRITNDIQWDIRIGCGLNHAADDLFTGTGLSVRWK